MLSRPFAAVAGALVVLVALAGGLLLYDGSRGDTIPKGVSVAGIDVGGMSPAAARSKLQADYLGALTKPVVVHWDKRSFSLTGSRAQVRANVDAMVDEAAARADDGNLLSRSWRRATGGEVKASLDPQVSYADRAIVKLLDRVRKAVDRKPVDAKIQFKTGGFVKQASKTGLTVDASTLHREIRDAIVSPTAKRSFVAQTRKLQPKVSSNQLARRNGTVLVVDRAHFKLKLYKQLALTKTYDIAVGMQGLETPAGLYHIQYKAENPAWNVPNSAWAGSLAGQVIPGGAANNPLKARWLGIIDGAGIHGIDPSEYGSIGTAGSHGCVRMRIEDVEDLYPRVPVGAPIYISG